MRNLLVGRSRNLNLLLRRAAAATCYYSSAAAAVSSRGVSQISEKGGKSNLVKPYCFLNPSSSSSSTCSNWNHHHHHHHLGSPPSAAVFVSHYSTSSSSEKEKEKEMKHQEIEGPTVERDVSPLADETREVSLRLMKTMYGLSSLMATLALTQLAVGGAWIYYYNYSSSLGGGSATATATSSISIALFGAVGFGLPLSMAFLLRQSLKPMHFFNKMELLGRLQILTATMQISKHLHLFFLRLRAVTFLCLAGLPLSLLLTLFSSSSSSQ